MDEKSTHFLMHVPPSIFGFLNPTTPITHSKIQWSIYKYIKFQMLTEKRAPPFCHFFLCLVPTQNKYIYIFLELSVFCFVLIHTQVIQVRNWYVIIYTMKKNHFTWTSVSNCLIGRLLFSCLSSQ